MRVELTEHPKGKQRFEISLGDICYVIDLEKAKELADDIYKLHPTAISENEAFRAWLGPETVVFVLAEYPLLDSDDLNLRRMNNERQNLIDRFSCDRR